MPIQLGAAFAPRPVVVEEPVHEVTVDSLQNEMLLSALASLHAALAEMPAPVVHVDQPDLSAIVQAVTALNGPATPEEIAKAIKDELLPGEQPKLDTTLEKLTEALDRLDFRLKGIASMGGGGGGGGGKVDMTPVYQDTRYEYDAGKVLYTGYAPPGTPASAAAWTIQKNTYTGDDLTFVEVKVGSWTGRDVLFGATPVDLTGHFDSAVFDTATLG